MAVTEDDTPEGSAAAGGCLLTAAAIGVGTAVYAVSQDTLVIAVWILGWGLIWRAARKKVPGTPDPPPPPSPEGAPKQEPQVSVIRDSSHPNRWLITRPSRWLGSSPSDKEQ